MTVYSKSATAEQSQLMKEFEELTGFEFLHQTALDLGEMTFDDTWRLNLQWYRDHIQEVTRSVEDLYTPEEA